VPRLVRLSEELTFLTLEPGALGPIRMEEYEVWAGM